MRELEKRDKGTKRERKREKERERERTRENGRKRKDLTSILFSRNFQMLKALPCPFFVSSHLRLFIGTAMFVRTKKVRIKGDRI